MPENNPQSTEEQIRILQSMLFGQPQVQPPVSPVQSVQPMTPPIQPQENLGPNFWQRLYERALQPMAGNLQTALGAGVPAIPAYNLYQNMIGQPFAKHVADPFIRDLMYIATGKEPTTQTATEQWSEANSPYPKTDYSGSSEPPIDYTKPMVKAIPKIAQVGTPQYTAEQWSEANSPYPKTDYSGSSEPPIDYTKPMNEQWSEANSPYPHTDYSGSSEPPIDYTKPMTKPAEVPDFTKLIKPWKPSTDYEKELMTIFEESVPKWADLPKAKSIEPKTPVEALTRFTRDVGLSVLGKDIFALKKGEQVEEEAKAAQEREYVIQRASKLANFKLSALAEKTRREEADRSGRAHWLETIGNLNPEFRKNPSYQAAVASIQGIPAEEGAALLQSMVNPETGQLEGMYERPEERMIKQQEALNNWQIKKLQDAGFPKDRAAFALATGSMDMNAFLINQYQNAKANNDTAGMRKAQVDIQDYRRLTEHDPLAEKAKVFLMNSDKIKKSGIFTDDTSFNFMKNWATTYTLLGKDAAKELKMPTQENVKINERVAQEAVFALGNRDREKAFFDKYSISPQTAFQVHYGVKEGQSVSTDLPEPFFTIAKQIPGSMKNPEKYMGMDEIGTNLKNNARDQIVLRYKPLLEEISGEGITKTGQAQAIQKVMRKTPLTDDEIYKIATQANKGDHAGLAEIIRQIYTTRGIKLNP